MRIEFDQTFDLRGERVHVKHGPIEAGEYIAFLARTDLGRQYPRERFAERVDALVKNVQISLIARNAANEVVGICFGLTDFAYWLFLTDLGVVFGNFAMSARWNRRAGAPDPRRAAGMSTFKPLP